MLGFVHAILCLLILSVAPIRPAVAQEVLRTADERFANLPDFDFASVEVNVPWGDQSLRMAAVDAGPPNGPVVLLLHGQPSWSFMYRHVIGDLTAAGYRVIAPDLIGYGRSDKPAAMESYSYQRHLDALVAFVRARDLRRATLVVHDWGGLLGFPLLKAMPERFDRVAIFNTSLNDGTDPETPRFKAGFDRWIDLLRTAPIVRVDEVIAAQTARPLPPDVAAAYMAPFPDGRYQSGVRRMSALIPRDPSYPMAAENAAVRAWLGGWTKPVMIAFSEDSDRLHPGQFELMNRLFSKADIRLSTRIAGTRHFLFEDRPEEAARLLRAFLADQQASPAADTGPSTTLGPLQADVATYVGFGDQRTGGEGARQSLAWMAARLTDLGYAVDRKAIPITLHVPETAQVKAGDAIAEGFPLWWPQWTDTGGVRAPLVPLARARPGDVALARLPYSRTASLYDPRLAPLLERIRAAEPRALVLVTEHPSGAPIALNVREETAPALLPAIPTLVIGEEGANWLAPAISAGTPVTLTIIGRSELGEDATLVARAGPEHAPAVVISTPRNGWFAAGGERGPGIAILLDLAARFRREQPDLPVVFVVTSHHEVGGAGMKAVLADPAFAPERVRLWLHLGANIATREAEATVGSLRFLDRPNDARGVTATADVYPFLEQAFRPGPPVALVPAENERPIGEITLVLRAGHRRAAGAVGYQLAHHSRFDTAEATSEAVMRPMADALFRFLDLAR